MKSKIASSRSMSNTGYHANGKPTWWARVGKGDSATFLDVGHVRGDHALEVEVDVPPGTIVYIGAGKGDHKTVRETVTTTAIAPTEADGPEAMIAWHEAKLAMSEGRNLDQTIPVNTRLGSLEPGVYPRSVVVAERKREIARLLEIVRLQAPALEAKPETEDAYAPDAYAPNEVEGMLSALQVSKEISETLVVPVTLQPPLDIMSDLVHVRQIHVYLGVVDIRQDAGRVAARRAAGDTDASDDVQATFLVRAPDGITTSHKNPKLALEQLASELRSIADSVLAASKRMK